jgi:hypothetical protein
VRFTAKARAAVAAGAGLDMDPRAIGKHAGIVTAASPRPGRGAMVDTSYASAPWVEADGQGPAARTRRSCA